MNGILSQVHIHTSYSLPIYDSLRKKKNLSSWFSEKLILNVIQVKVSFSMSGEIT